MLIDNSASPDGDDAVAISRRFQFGMRHVLAVVLVSATGMGLAAHLAMTPAALVVLMIVLFGFVIGSRSQRLRLVIILFCIYAPYSWLLRDYPWHDYRISWILMWPILPGMLPGAYFFHARSDTLELSLMAVVSLLVIGGCMMATARKRRVQIISLVIVTGLSILNSMIVNGLYRA